MSLAIQAGVNHDIPREMLGEGFSGLPRELEESRASPNPSPHIKENRLSLSAALQKLRAGMLILLQILRGLRLMVGATISAQTLLTLRGPTPTAFFPALNFPLWFTVNAATRSPHAAEM